MNRTQASRTNASVGLVGCDDPLNSTGDQRGAWSWVIFKARWDADDGLEILRLSLPYLLSWPVSI
jgi:hypothetical protein